MLASVSSELFENETAEDDAMRQSKSKPLKKEDETRERERERERETIPPDSRPTAVPRETNSPEVKEESRNHVASFDTFRFDTIKGIFQTMCRPSRRSLSLSLSLTGNLEARRPFSTSVLEWSKRQP